MGTPPQRSILSRQAFLDGVDVKIKLMLSRDSLCLMSPLLASACKHLCLAAGEESAGGTWGASGTHGGFAYG